MTKRRSIIAISLGALSIIISLILTMVFHKDWIVIGPLLVSLVLLLIYNFISINILNKKKKHYSYDKELSFKRFILILFIVEILISLFCGFVIYNTL